MRNIKSILNVHVSRMTLFAGVLVFSNVVAGTVGALMGPASTGMAAEDEAAIPASGFPSEPAPASGAVAVSPSATSPLSVPVAAPTGYAGVRIDCMHNFNRNKGQNQNCLAVSGLRIGLLHEMSPTSRAHIRVDPFASPSASMESSPLRDSYPLTTELSLGIIDFYSALWSPRPNLDIGVESYNGATAIPTMSGLTLIDSMTDEGWKQTAVTLTYHLAAANGVRVRFALGNGEGENGRNLDPQQYFGFEVRAPIVQGLAFVGGLSFDGNSVGSDRFAYEQKLAACGLTSGGEKPSSGYSAQRFGAGLEMDGTAKAAPGFKFGLGWQKSTLVDLQKSKKSYPLDTDLSVCEQLDPGEIFVESSDLEKANMVQRTTVAINVAYNFAETWFVGADVRQRKVDVGDVNLFQSCSSFRGTACAADGLPSNQAKQTGWTVGGGKELAPGMLLDFGYSRVAFDKKYNKFNYLGKNDKSTEMLELFNARVAYNWR